MNETAKESKCFFKECNNIATEFYPMYMPNYGVCKNHLKWFEKVLLIKVSK